MDKQLSKEEILKSNHAEKVINWEKVFVQNPTIIQSAYEAMDTYAKQEAIAFAEWTERQDYTLVFETNLWGQIGNRQNYTTEQLYSLYQSK